MVKKILAYSYIYLILLLLYLPILVLIVFSFSTDTNIGSFTEFGFKWYVELFSNKELLVALANTVILAIISAIVSTILGTIGAIGTFYSKKRTRFVIEQVNQIPVVNAEIVMALSLTVMFVFIGQYIFKGYSMFSFFTLLIGHVVLSLPFVYLNVKPKLMQMDSSIYEAALDLGCTPSRALYKIVFPQILPGVASGFLLAITLSLDDFIITAFTRGPGLLNGSGQIETLSTYVQSKIKKGPIPPELRALTTILFLAVLGIVIFSTVRNNLKAKKTYKARRGRA